MATTTTAEVRIAAFQGSLRAAGVDAALLLNLPDVFYFTGTKQPANLLILTDAALEPTLFVRRWGATLSPGDIIASGENLWRRSGHAFTVA